MPRDLHSPRYDRLRALVTAARKDKGLTQAEVARRLARPQSYVADIERRERRIDVIEFIDLANAIGVDPAALFSAVVA